MKLERLVEIITILLNKKNVTAAELADRFDVSVRTIYRDIDALSAAGVPVCTTQGQNGGISVMDGYALNRTLLSDSDKDSILFALHSLQAAKYPEIDAVLEKLGGIFKNSAADWISVDFSPWGSNPNAYHKFTDIKTAILHGKVIEIDYLNAQNQKSTRYIEPLRLDFKYQAWYLWGWCRNREDYRMFRISRVKRVHITDEIFDRFRKREPKPQKGSDGETGYKPNIHCVLQFTEDALYRLYDDYDDDRLQDNGDGTYTLEFDFPEDAWVYSYILSFGTAVKVLSPPHLQKIIKEKSKKIFDFYSGI